jgi:hypothetical protein
MSSSIPSFARSSPVRWILVSLVILLVEYATGPHIQFSILFVLPVALATVSQGLTAGLTLALALPVLRLGFFLQWPLLSSWAVHSLDSAVDIAILTGVALICDRIVRQEQQIRVLEGLLPICSFCKRIRDEAGEWKQVESYVAARSQARFSHTFCPECGRRHYPDLID